MNLRHLLIVCFASLALLSCATPSEVKVDSQDLTCESSVNSEIRKGVEQWRTPSQKGTNETSEKQKPLRTAFFQLSFPLDEQEAASTNQMALLSVTLLSHSKEDFPLGQVLLRPQGMEGASTSNAPWVDLPRVLPGHWVQEIPAYSDSYRYLGSWIQTAYFYVPIRFFEPKDERESRWEVIARPENKMTSISAGLLPLRSELKRVAPKVFGKKENPQQPPNLQSTFRMLRRDFCFGAPVELP